jgi:superfamily I DNA and RNA helicase
MQALNSYGKDDGNKSGNESDITTHANIGSINERLASLEEDVYSIGKVYPELEETDVEDHQPNETQPQPTTTTVSKHIIKWIDDNKTTTVYATILGILTSTIAILYAAKPKFIMTKYRGKKVVDWMAMSKWGIVIAIVLSSMVLGSLRYYGHL